MPEQQEFPVCLAAGWAAVSTPTEIDISNAVQLRTALLSAASGNAIVVVDMSRTMFCDSAALNVLVRAHKRAIAEGGELRLVISDPHVLRIFTLTGVDRVFPIFASLPDALATKHTPPTARADPDAR